MKNLFPLAGAFGLALNFTPSSIQAQTPWEHNEGLLITEGATSDTVVLSWWGRMFHAYEIEVSDNLMQWDALPEVIEGLGAPVARELNIPGSDNRWFMRIRKSPLPIPIAGLFSENSNLEVIAVDHIGSEDMRGAFSGGQADGLPIDSGWVFSTGKAEDWDDVSSRQREQIFGPGDPDLEYWMRTQGFYHFRQNPGPLLNYETRDASGITFDFEVDPSVALGELQVAFFFASEEYEIHPDFDPKNDGMAIFVSEIDWNGEVIPGTRANIGVLPETETHSRAISVMNAGTVLHEEQEDVGVSANVQESGFTLNSANQPPNSFGYAGFTGRFVASGGPAAVYEDVSLKTRIRQANITDGAGHGEYGWGGVVLRGQHDLDHQFSGYAVAFGRNSGDVVFTLYKIQDHRTFNPSDPIHGYNVHSSIIPNDNDPTFPSDTVEVLESIEVMDFEFTEGEWYWIRAEIEGDTIRARFWEGDEENEPSNWAIEYFDDEDPLGPGFLGLVHLDTGSDLGAGGDPSDNSDLQWDLFEVDDGSTVIRSDFGNAQNGKQIPFGWVSSSLGAREWEIREDAGSIGGKYIKHDLEGEIIVSILRYEGPGKVEGGKRYRVKAVVADAEDPDWDAALFLENGSIGVATVSE